MPKPTTFTISDDPAIHEHPPTANPAPAIAPQPPTGEFHTSIYIDPALLLDSQNVRPGETIAGHDARVARLARQIMEDGQQVPVIVACDANADDTNGGAYRVVAGQGRIDALRLLNTTLKSNGDDDLLLAWCVLDIGSDPWATAVKENVHRENYSDLQLAELIREAQERYGWKKGKGGGKKCAEFFGLTEPHLVEYNKLAAAPQDVKDRLASGELSKFGALKLLSTTSADDTPAATERRAKVAKKAKEISQEETDRKYASSHEAFKKEQRAGTANKPSAAKAEPVSTPPPSPSSPPAKPAPKVKAEHIAQAAREVAKDANEAPPVVKRNRTEILAAIANLLEFSPVTAMDACREFLEALLKFADGSVSPRQLQNRWNVIIGTDSAPKK